jgi:4-amino-4-deoxy-L-arabinose transferase-like glycosyltransferase
VPPDHLRPPESDRRCDWPLRGTAALFTIIVAITMGTRVFGPSDLYEKDQVKTMGYTADIVDNDQWLLPRDTLGQRTTKPPLYNWLGAAPLFVTRWYSEFMFKLPSLLAGTAVVLLVIATARHAAEVQACVGNRPPHERSLALQSGLLAGMLWLACAPVMKQVYLARPDMLLTAFTTGAWVCGTAAMRAAPARWQPAAGFWVCVAAAALSKGPAALLPVAYVVLASRLIFGKFAAMRKLNWGWGAPLALALVGLWLVPVALRDGAHLYDVMIRDELVNRVLRGGPENNVAGALWQMPAWFLTQFAPWSALCALALVSGRGVWRGPLAPAALWLVLGVAFFSCSAGKRADYLAPVYTQASVLGACWLTDAVAATRFPIWRLAVVPALFAAALGLNHLRYSREAQQPYARHVKQFAADCRAVVGRDRVLFLVNGYHPFLPLIGRGGRVLDETQLNRAGWLLCPPVPGWPAVVVSRELQHVHGRSPGTVALYRMPQDQAGRAQVRRILRRVQVHNAPSPSSSAN